MMPIHKPRRRFVAVCSAVFSLCFTSVPLLSEHGRNFAGEFQVRDVVDEGSMVMCELHIKVFNFSGADLKDATLTLADRRPGRSPEAIDYQGSFSGVFIPYRKSIELEGSFLVPVREYRAWQRGAVPNLVVTDVDESGKEVRNPVELRPVIIGGLPKGEGR